MRRRLAAYLFGKLAPLAFAVNFVCNGLAGWLTFPPGARVPLSALRGDCAVTAFIVALITVLLTLPAARREVWAGRVPGFGIRALRLPNRHPLATALALALLAAAASTALASALLAGAGMLSLAGREMILFKALFASGVGVCCSLSSALLAIGPERAPPRDVPPRAEPALAALAAPGPSWPLDYFDKGALSVTDSSRGCSGVLTWQLRVEGALAPDEVLRALAWLAVRYPQLSTRVEPQDGNAPWASHYRYVQREGFRAEQLFQFDDLSSAPERFAAGLALEINRPFDPFLDLPVTLRLVRLGEMESRLLFRMHHMIADGRAFIALLADFARLVEHARARTAPSAAELAPVPRRGDLAPLALGPLARLSLTAQGMLWLLRKYLRNSLSPLTPLLQNQSLDYTGEDGSLHWSLPDAVLERWHAARARLGASLNSFLTGALLEAAARWHRAAGRPLGRTVASLLVETRPRGAAFSSFANHLAMHEVSVDLARLRDAPGAIAQVQRQVEAQRRARVPQARLCAERVFVLPMPLGDMQRIVFEPRQLTSNLYFSNLLALPFPSLQGSGFCVSEVVFTSPVAPRTGIIVTALRYGGQLVFNFNHKSSAVTRGETQAFLDSFKRVLEELAD